VFVSVQCLHLSECFFSLVFNIGSLDADGGCCSRKYTG